MDARAEKCQRQYNQINSDIHRIEVEQAPAAAKTVNELSRNLRSALNEFTAATRMSNVGSSQFVDALEDIIRKLDTVETFLGNIDI